MTISKISSKATGPIVTKFHVELLVAEGMKIGSNCPGIHAKFHDFSVMLRNLKDSHDLTIVF